MSVKETIHEWIESMPESDPELLEMYEQARLDLAIGEAVEDVRKGRTTPVDQVIAEHEEQCRARRLQSR